MFHDQEELSWLRLPWPSLGRSGHRLNWSEACGGEGSSSLSFPSLRLERWRCCTSPHGPVYCTFGPSTLGHDIPLIPPLIWNTESISTLQGKLRLREFEAVWFGKGEIGLDNVEWVPQGGVFITHLSEEPKQ